MFEIRIHDRRWPLNLRGYRDAYRYTYECVRTGQPLNFRPADAIARVVRRVGKIFFVPGWYTPRAPRTR